MENIIDTKAGMDVLIYLNDKKTSYASMISMDLRITYSHVCKVIKLLKSKKLIVLEPEGRLVYITITDKGKEAAKNIMELRK